MAAAVPSVRERAVEGLQQLLQSIAINGTPVDASGNVLPAPFNSPYGEEFSTQSVFREPPKGIASGRRAVAVITDVAETKSEMNYGMVDCELTVYVEAHILRHAGETMSVVLNKFLAVIERAIRASRTYGVPGVVDTKILGNEVALEGGPYANYGSCVTKCIIYYRHTTLDPTLAPGPLP